MLNAIGLYVLAQFVKTMRLYVVLGSYRIPFLPLFTISTVGVAASFGVADGIPLIYELVVIGFLLLFFKLPLMASCYTLVILRIFDALCLIIALPLFRFDFSNRMALCFVGLAVIGYLLISTLPAILWRVERKILQSALTHTFYTQFLKRMVTAREEINALSFVRKGTLPLAVLLTLMIWGLEVLALSYITGNLMEGGQAVLSRIAGSLRIVPNLNLDYSSLLYALMVVVTVCSGTQLLMIKRGRHD